MNSRDGEPGALRLSMLLGLMVVLVLLLAGAVAGGPVTPSVGLTEQERAWLRAHPVISVVQDTGWPPIEFSDGRGGPWGMSGDYLSLVEQRLGIRFQRVPEMKWQDAYGRLKRWEIDMTTCVGVTPQREAFWAFTQPYIEIPVVIVARSDVTYIANIRELEGKRVAVVDGYSASDWIPRDYPGIRLIRVKTTREGLESVQRGDAFAYIENMAIVGYHLAKLKTADLKVAGETPYVNRQCMAVRKDWAPLAGILQKALASIPQTERDGIYRKWLPVRYEHGFNRILLGQSLAASAAILAGLLLWNRRLAREVGSRRKAEAALRESEQRLSHTIEATRAGTWDWSVQTGEAVFNERWADIIGYRLCELSPVSIRTWTDYAHPDDLLRSYEQLAKHFAGELPYYDIECRMKHRDGHWVWVHDLGRVTHWAQDGKPLRMVGTHMDISERKQLEDAQRFLLQCGWSSGREDFFGSLARYLAETLGMGYICIDRLSGDCLSAQTVAIYNDGRFEDNVEYALVDTPCGEVVGRTVCCFPKGVRHLFPRDEALQTLVAESFVGVTLWSAAGRPIGLIAAIGREPLANPRMADALLGLVAVRAAGELERREAERQAGLEQERVVLALDASGDSIWDSNGSTGEVHVSPRYYQMLGYPVGDLVRPSEATRDLVHPEDLPQLLVANECLGATDTSQHEYRVRAMDGSWRWILTRSRVVERAPTGTPIRVIGVDTDMTDRRRREEELGFVSSHDKLTGLFNRRHMESYLRTDEALSIVPTTLIMGDVNGLKLINDTFGHEEGDRLLVLIADLMRGAVGELGTVARWGGDEFFAVLPGLDGATSLELTHRIQAACAAFPRDPFPLSVALGVATRLAPGQAVDDVMREAEEHMYHSKLMEGKSARSTVIAALRETLSAKTFETDEHCRRMQSIAVDVAKHMGLADNTRDDTLLLALLHDIGKIGVPEAILAKPGRLTPEERLAIEKHAEIGFRIAKASYELGHIAEGILSHHEWWNGAGYPQGLSGQAIPLIARIIGVIDAYDAMTSDRPYRAALTRAEALEELRGGSGTQFDPEVVAAVIATVSVPEE